MTQFTLFCVLNVKEMYRITRLLIELQVYAVALLQMHTPVRFRLCQRYQGNPAQQSYRPIFGIEANPLSRSASVGM